MRNGRTHDRVGELDTATGDGCGVETKGMGIEGVVVGATILMRECWVSEVEAGLPALDMDPVGAEGGGAVIVEAEDGDEEVVMLIEADLQGKDYQSLFSRILDGGKLTDWEW